MTETIEQATELVDRAEIKGGTVLVEYSRTEAALAELRAKYQGATYDLTTTAGDKAARAARLELVKLRTSLESKRKEFKAPALEFGRKIDAEAARINGEILALENPIDAQIKADEKRREDERLERERIEAARVAAIKSKIDAIRACAVRANSPDMTSERIQRGIDQVEAIGIDAAGFAEFAEEAAQAKSTTLAAMLNLRDQAKAREDEAARLEAQRLENERIAAQQRAAAEALEAQQRALAEREAALAAQQKALDDAREEAERKERERLEAQREAEAQAAAAIAAAQNSQAQDSQQVLKAEPETADATDRDAPVISGPSVGSMGAGQAADAAPVAGTVHVLRQAKQPTLSLGTIKERLGFVVTADYLAGLGFHAVTVKAAKLYQEEDWPRICDAICASVQAAKSREEVAA